MKKQPVGRSWGTQLGEGAMCWKMFENLRHIVLLCSVSFKICQTSVLNVVHHFKVVFSPRPVSFSGRLMYLICDVCSMRMFNVLGQYCLYWTFPGCKLRPQKPAVGRSPQVSVAVDGAGLH